MNRSLIFALVLTSASFQAHAQGLTLCQQVIGAAGKSSQQGNRYFSYTLGEPFIATLSSATSTITQGFHQPELCQIVATQNVDLLQWQIEIFPNPTSDFLNVRFEPVAGARLVAHVYDLLGHCVVPQVALDQPDGTKIDCTGLQAGVYFLQLSNPAGKTSAIHRFIRL